MRPNLHDLAAEFMPEHGVGFEMVLAFDDLDVTAANPDRMDLDDHIIGVLGMRNWPLLKFNPADIFHNQCFHRVHIASPWWELICG